MTIAWRKLPLTRGTLSLADARARARASQLLRCDSFNGLTGSARGYSEELVFPITLNLTPAQVGGISSSSAPFVRPTVRGAAPASFSSTSVAAVGFPWKSVKVTDSLARGKCAKTL